MCIFIYEINLDTKYISFLNLDLIMFTGFISRILDIHRMEVKLEDLIFFSC